jgi:hypothetical protein
MFWVVYKYCISKTTIFPEMVELKIYIYSISYNFTSKVEGIVVVQLAMNAQLLGKMA